MFSFAHILTYFRIFLFSFIAFRVCDRDPSIHQYQVNIIKESIKIINLTSDLTLHRSLIGRGVGTSGIVKREPFLVYVT